MEENTNLDENGSVSGNDPGTSDPGAGNQEEHPSPAPQPGQEEEKPKPEEPAAETGGENGTEKLDEVIAQLDIIKQQSGQESPLPEFTDTLKELIRVMSPNPAEEETPVIMLPSLPDGYQDYRYPIEVQIEVRPKGSDYSMGMGLSCTMPNQFADEIADLTTQVESGIYDMARVQYVYETGDDGKTNVLVYDYEHVVSPEQPEEKDEPAETDLTALELLETISADLQSISDNTVAYQTEQREYWQDIKDLQQMQTAGVLIVAVGIFIMAGILSMAELFRKWK